MNINRVAVSQEPWSADYQIRLGEFDRQMGINKVAIGFEAKEYKLGEMVPSSFVLTPEVAMQLMDELWKLGCRPSAAKAIDYKEQSNREALEDMKVLVEKAFDVKFKS